MTTNPSYEASYYDGVEKSNVPSKDNTKQPYRCPVHQKQRDVGNDNQRDQQEHPTHKTKEDERCHDHHCHRCCGRDYPIHPYWAPYYNPYLPPAFPPGMYPPDQPFFRYENDDARAQPFNMYDPMDRYYPRYPPGPGGYYMPATRYPRNSRRKYKGNKKSLRNDKEVGFQDEVEEEYFDPNEVDPYLIEEAQKSKLKVRLGLLILLVVLLIASIVLGAVAAAMEPWLVQEKTTGTTTFDSVKVGLWRTCTRAKATDEWSCRKYSEKGNASEYKNITLLQWSMIVGTISVFIAVVFAVVTIIVRKSRYVRGLLFVMIFFTIGATILFGLVIGYINEDKNTKGLPGKTSTMFAIGCAATATSGMAFILCCAMAFIYEPYIKSEEEDIEIEGINDSIARGNGRIGRNDGWSRNVRLNSGPALITKANEANEANGEEPLQSGQTDNKDELPQRDENVIHEMKPRDEYPLQDEGSLDYQNGMEARPPKKRLTGGPPSYFKRTPGSTGTMINPHQAKKSSGGILKQDGSQEIAIYGGDYNTYFDEPY